ncbi:MAG: hypothetical protein V7721_06985 [Porticoccaceae bacterium]
MKKTFFCFSVFAVLSVLASCTSVPGPSSKYSYGDDEIQAVVILSAPNLSSFHKPPLTSSLAFIKVYKIDDVCEKRKTLFGEAYKQAEPIGEIYVSKADKVKSGKLPVGNIVIRSGFDIQGIGSRMTCDRYFQFTSKENHEYEIEVKESRPFVTSCYVLIREKDSKGNYSEKLGNFQHSVNGGFLNMEEDVSPMCGNQNQHSI